MTAQLIKSYDGSQIWSERYDRSEGDVFDIQEEIANAIVRNLKGRLVNRQCRRSGVPPTTLKLPLVEARFVLVSDYERLTGKPVVTPAG